MIESTVLAAGFWHPAQVRPHLPLSGPFWLLHKDLMALTQHRLRPGPLLGSAYCTIVGVY
mgnify:FL=1